MSGEREGHTLQTTALVNEAYVRLVDSSQVQWQNRAHFFAVAAQLMRRVLVDFARTRSSQKRGGEVLKVEFDEAWMGATDRGGDLVVALDDALQELAKFDARKSQVVEMRFFAGLSATETAEVLKVSEDTVLRDWKLAKTWLLRRTQEGQQTMKSDRWQKIDEIFHAALQHKPDERKAFIEEASRGDEELRREVESLLAEREKRISSSKNPQWNRGKGSGR